MIGRPKILIPCPDKTTAEKNKRGASEAAALRANLEFKRTLMAAARRSHIEEVKLLLDKGADVNTKTTYGGYTALMIAARKGHIQVVNYLKAHGAR